MKRIFPVGPIRERKLEMKLATLLTDRSKGTSEKISRTQNLGFQAWMRKPGLGPEFHITISLLNPFIKHRFMVSKDFVV